MFFYMLFNFHNHPVREAECGSSGNNLGRQWLSHAVLEIEMPHCPSPPFSPVDKARAARRNHSWFLSRCSACSSGTEWELDMGWAFLATLHSPPWWCSERQSWEAFGAAWVSSSSQIRALSENEVEGQWPWNLKPSKVLLSFSILFCSLSHFSPPCFQHKSPTKRLLLLSLDGDYKRIELAWNACLNIFMCYNLSTHYKATQNSGRCHRLLIPTMQFEKAYSSLSKIFISHRWSL